MTVFKISIPMQKAEACASIQSSQVGSRKLIDIYCPVHNNWIGHYEYGSIGAYYCYCKRCRKEIRVMMGL